MDEMKVTTARVKIGGIEYMISAVAEEDYIKKVAEYTDNKLTEVTEADKRLPANMAAILTAVNVADELFKAKEDSMTLRGQLLEYAEEAGSLRTENSKLVAENKRLSEQNRNLQSTNQRLENELRQYRRNGKR